MKRLSKDEMSPWRAASQIGVFALLLGMVLGLSVLLEETAPFATEPHVLRRALVSGAVNDLGMATGMIVSLIFALALTGAATSKTQDGEVLRFRRQMGGVAGLLVSIQSVILLVAFIGLWSDPEQVASRWWVFPVAVVASLLGVELSRFVGRPTSEKLALAKERLCQAESVLARTAWSEGASISRSLAVTLALALTPSFVLLVLAVPPRALLGPVVFGMVGVLLGTMVAIERADDPAGRVGWLAIMFWVHGAINMLLLIAVLLLQGAQWAALAMAIAFAVPMVSGTWGHRMHVRVATLTLAAGAAAWRRPSWAAKRDAFEVEVHELKQEVRAEFRL